MNLLPCCPCAPCFVVHVEPVQRFLVLPQAEAERALQEQKEKEARALRAAQRAHKLATQPCLLTGSRSSAVTPRSLSCAGGGSTRATPRGASVSILPGATGSAAAPASQLQPPELEADVMLTETRAATRMIVQELRLLAAQHQGATSCLCNWLRQAFNLMHITARRWPHNCCVWDQTAYLTKTLRAFADSGIIAALESAGFRVRLPGSATGSRAGSLAGSCPSSRPGSRAGSIINQTTAVVDTKNVTKIGESRPSSASSSLAGHAVRA
jgi:hypothetical protein